MTVKLVKGRFDDGGPCYEIKLLDDDGAILVRERRAGLEESKAIAKKWRAAVEDGTAESMLRPVANILRFP